MDNAQLCGRALGDHRNGVALGAGDGCNPRVDSPLSAVAVYLDARVAEKSGAKLRRQGDRRLLGHSGLRLLAGSQQRQHVRRRRIAETHPPVQYGGGVAAAVQHQAAVAAVQGVKSVYCVGHCCAVLMVNKCPGRGWERRLIHIAYL